MMRYGEVEVYGGYEIRSSTTGYTIHWVGSEVVLKEFDTLSEAYDFIDAEESEDTRWEVIKIKGDTAEFGKWAVYPPGVVWYGGWVGLFDTWEEAQAEADARAYGRK